MLDQERNWQKPCHAIPDIEMDIPRKSAAKKRLIKRILVGLLVLGVVGVLFGLSMRLKPAEASLQDLKVQLQSTTLTQKAVVAGSTSDYHTAQLKADRDSQLVKEGLVPEVDAKISTVMAAELKTRMEIEQERLRITADSTKAQIEAKSVTIEQLRATYKLKQKEVGDLKVKAGTEGTLQA